MMDQKKVLEAQESSDPLSLVNMRFEKMRGERTPFDREWDLCDKQFDADVKIDDEGKERLNTNIEQSLIEWDVGSTSNDLVFDVKPDGYDTNVQQLEASKHVLKYFIEKEDFKAEYRTFKQDKSRYGTAVFGTGLRCDIDYVAKYNEKDVNDSQEAFYSKDTYMQRREMWKFTPKNVPIRHFFIDDQNLYQNNFNLVEDCIMLEPLTKTQFLNKYQDHPYINKAALDAVPISEDNPSYGISSPRGKIVVYHYYNKTTKQYIITVNKTALLYEGHIMYKNGKLPFVVCQHYPDSACIYGISTPRKVRTSKAYKNNIMQSIMDGSRMSTGKLVVMGASGDAIDGDFYVNS